MSLAAFGLAVAALAVLAGAAIAVIMAFARYVEKGGREQIAREVAEATEQETRRKAEILATRTDIKQAENDLDMGKF